MPDYFYHISIELFDDDTRPVNLSQTFKALNPFTSQKPRVSRDVRYDGMRPNATSTPRTYISASMIPSTHEDNRIDDVLVETADDITAGIGTKFASAQTRATFAATEETENAERGIVHLYRDAEPTSGLYHGLNRVATSELWSGSAPARGRLSSNREASPPQNEECTMLAILAVPSYMTPRDFLAFVGQSTRDAVNHFRMVRTARLNRYMVLMRFKDGRFARQWQSDWNLKLFNNMEPESCQVVFVKSVEVVHNQDLHKHENSQGDQMSGEPRNFARESVSQYSRPIAPPTPSLVELPTCPVCLERMDESTGLITNLCQHVFHCTCLEKWSGFGCPVCRFKDDSFGTGTARSSKSKKTLNAAGEYDVVEEQDLDCYDCRTSQSLWSCLICGVIGCGRYAGKHAYRHYQATGHAFALDLENHRVWDYDRDCYVHRIIANGSSLNEKLIEMPGPRRDGQVTALEHADEDLEMAKRENLAFEYTQLLTSQLESQRMYFEDLVAKAIDNKNKAVKQADKDALEAESVQRRFEEIDAATKALQDRLELADKAATRYEEHSKRFEIECKAWKRKYEDEKTMSNNLSENAKAMTIQRNQLFTNQSKQIQELQEENATKNFYIESLQEQINDLRVQVAAATKLQRMVQQGELTQEEVEGSTLFAGPPRLKTGSSSVGPVADRPLRKQKLHGTQVASVKRLEPTDTEVQEAVDNTPAGYGPLSRSLLDDVGPDYEYARGITEKDVNSFMGAEKSVKLVDDKNFERDSSMSAPDLAQALVSAGLLVPKSSAGDMLKDVLADAYELASGITGDEIRAALLEKGILQPRQEAGLYDSDDDDDPSGIVAKSKAKRKKKSKKRK